MMEKKRKSVGIILVGVFGIIIGILQTVSSFFIMTVGEFTDRTLLLGFNINILFGVAFTICSVFILRLRNWSRILFIWIIAIYTAGGIFANDGIRKIFGLSKSSYLLSILFQPPLIPLLYYFWIPVYLASIIYFTRPKVKEQFK